MPTSSPSLRAPSRSRERERAIISRTKVWNLVLVETSILRTIRPYGATAHVLVRAEIHPLPARYAEDVHRRRASAKDEGWKSHRADIHCALIQYTLH
jgi:hypothetical protein